nr:IgaA/UmoB family intracellular growth attenuator [uncultured Desulfobacter sp.]
MDTIHGILVLIVFCMSVYSMISYSIRRGANKSNFKKINKKQIPSRKLSPGERSALEPFLFVNGSKKPLKLQGDDVFVLTGKFLRHGIEAQNAKTMHDTIGGVEVILPYDAAAFLVAEENKAEVVLTEKLAIVITLNGVFDLAGGQKRDQEQQHEALQWKRGDVGEYAETEQETEADARTKVHIYGQRDETREEMAQRNSPGLGMLPAFLLIIGVVAALYASQAETTTAVTWACAAAIGLTVLSILSFMKGSNRQVSPKPVNRAKGYLNTISLPNPNNSALHTTQHFLGTKLPVIIPGHWSRFLDRLPEKALDVDIRVEDTRVLSIGSFLSTAEEYRRFPAVYWGRHFTLALVAVIGVIIVFNWMPNPSIDLILSRYAIDGATPVSLTADQADAAAALKQGDLVHINARVRCQLPDNVSGNQLPAPDSRLLKWGGTLPEVDDLDVDEKIKPFLDKEAFQYYQSRLLGLAMQSWLGNNQIYRNPWESQERVVLLAGWSKLAGQVDDFCSLPAVTASSDAVNRCTSLEKQLITDVVRMDGKHYESWEALLADASKKNKKKTDQGAVYLSTLGSMANQAQDIAESIVFLDAKAKLEKANKSVTGGVLLDLSYRTRDRLNFNTDRADLVSTWSLYQHIGDVKNTRELELTGIVLDNTPDAAGIPVLTLSDNYTQDQAFSALIRVSTLGVLLLLGVLHILMMLAKLRRSALRKKQVDQFLDSQMG